MNDTLNVKTRGSWLSVLMESRNLATLQDSRLRGNDKKSGKRGLSPSKRSIISQKKPS
jgi:hypothetical protein